MNASDITALLQNARSGDQAARDALGALVYDQLRALAHKTLRSGRPGNTLQTTALVHEAYLKMAAQPSASFEAREHFFAFAARVMRSVLVDHERRRRAAKRGGGEPSVPLDEVLEALAETSVNLLDLDDALTRLEAMDERLARLVELRFFAGLSVEEAARELEVSVPTAVRNWRTARAWLRGELSPAE